MRGNLHISPFVGTVSTGGGRGGGGSPLFAADLDAASPYAFDSVTTHAAVTIALATGAGPNGGNAIRFTHNITGGSGQYNYGYDKSVESQPTIGTTRYIRIWMKFEGTQSWGTFTNKFIAVGSDDGDPTGLGGRSILYLREGSPAFGDSGNALYLMKNIGYDGPKKASIPNSAGFAFQFSITSGDAVAVQKIWYNNDTFSSPTASTTGMSISTWGWGGCGIGFFGDSILQTGDAVQYLIGGYEYDDAFDATWYSRMGAW